MSRGSRVLQNLHTTGFEGRVYGINPNYQQVQGFPCYASVSDIPGQVDCVVVAIPAPGVVDVLENAYAAGVRGAVVLSSGFGEGGHSDAERVARIAALADRGMSICGPNCYGVLNVHTGAAAFSGRIADPLVKGGVGLVSQSGGFSNVVADPLMEDRNVGFSSVISCGNQLGLSVEDYLGYLADDPATKVLAAFVEGFRNPAKLADAARRAAVAGKPIIVLKSGRTEAGKAAARSHTGALSGSTEVLTALLRRLGIIQVSGIDELIETIALFAVTDIARPISREIVVVTGSGGEGSHAADAAASAGLGMATLSDTVSARILDALPEFGAASNPLDGTGTIFESDDLFPRLFDAVLSDERDDVVAVNLSARTPKESFAPMRQFAHAVAKAAGSGRRTIVTYGTSALGSDDRQLIDTVQSARIPYLAGTQYAMRAIASLYEYQRNRGRVATAEPLTPPKPAARADLPAGVLPFLTARDLLADFGVPVAETGLATSAEDAAALADRIGYPVAVKAEAANLVHKSDVGGVVLGCRDRDEVAAAYARVTERVRAAGYPDISGALVQAMPAGGVETIAGVTVDPVLGPAVVFGLGGIFVELIRDVVTEVAPLSLEEAKDMIGRVRGARILGGARGRQPSDVDSLARLLVGLGELAHQYAHRVVSIDVNPILVGPSGAVAVDALVELNESRP